MKKMRFGTNVWVCGRVGWSERLQVLTEEEGWEVKPNKQMNGSSIFHEQHQLLFQRAKISTKHQQMGMQRRNQKWTWIHVINDSIAWYIAVRSWSIHTCKKFNWYIYVSKYCTKYFGLSVIENIVNSNEITSRKRFEWSVGNLWWHNIRTEFKHTYPQSEEDVPKTIFEMNNCGVKQISAVFWAVGCFSVCFCVRTHGAIWYVSCPFHAEPFRAKCSFLWLYECHAFY